MKTCLIAPVPDLGRYITSERTHHLCLTHLMGIPGYGEFYADRSVKGDYVILDNGAKERGAGLGMEDVLMAGAMIEAQEVVLTDVRYKCTATIDAGTDGLRWIQEDGLGQYHEAGCPKLMVVPQGENIREWKVCLSSLLTLVGVTRGLIPEMPEPTVGFAYHYDHLYEGGLLKLLDEAKIETLDIHLLGWPRRLQTLREVAESYPFIRSVDSGRPFSYAKAGKACLPGEDNPGRDENFFETPTPDKYHQLVLSNIEVFRSFAEDE